MQICISISSAGAAAHPESELFCCSSLEVKDLKGQNPSWWQLSSKLEFCFCSRFKGREGNSRFKCPPRALFSGYRYLQVPSGMSRITFPEAPGRLTTSKGHSHHGTHTDPPLAPSSPAQHSCCPHGKSREENPAAAFCKIQGIFPRSVELKLLAAALSIMWEARSAPPVPEHSSPSQSQSRLQRSTHRSQHLVCVQSTARTDGHMLGTLPEILCCSWEKSMPSPMELMIFSIWK